MSKKKKAEQLGMNPSTASARLKKNLMFKMVQMLELDTCFQCGDKINSARELSVEHKIPWLDSNDPIGLFFDLENIAFSHLTCNIGAIRNDSIDSVAARNKIAKSRRIVSPDGMSWCQKCRQHLNVSNFTIHTDRWNGLSKICKACRRKKYADNKK